MDSFAKKVIHVGDQVGDYLFESILIDGDEMCTWKAKQVSVSRGVIIDSLILEEGDNEPLIAAFLDDVRAKAKVDHPHIGSVFEAYYETPHCFYARERLQGDNLEVLLAKKQAWKPKQLLRIIAQLAEANYFFEKHKVATLPVLPEHIFVGDELLTRVINMAVGGEYDPTVGLQDRVTIAKALKPMMQKGLPGATRVSSLLDHMCDVSREVPMTWIQVLELSRQVEADLTYAVTEEVSPATVRLDRRRRQQEVIAIISIVFIIFSVLVGVSQMFDSEPKVVARDLSQMVQIEAATVQDLTGEQVKIEGFWADAHEVTIAEYADFLEVMDMFTPKQRKVYQHENQPDSKLGHQPDDWDAMYAAAVNSGEWNGLKIDLNCPVVGVDWWDAFTYCEHIRKRLPTLPEWRSLAAASTENDSKLSPSAWGNVDLSAADRTSVGVFGLAGNVSEWLADQHRDPASPVKPEMWVIAGGSYNAPEAGELTFHWLDPVVLDVDDARNFRSPTLGFRAVSDRAPRE